MADNTTSTAGDVIATDDVTTLNGSASSGVKVERVKVMHGDDGTATDASSTNPLPVTVANTGSNSTAIKVDGSAVTQPVSGTVTVQQSTASNLKVDLSGTAANATAVKVDGSAVTQPVSGTFWQATQPVSGTVTATLGTSSIGQLVDNAAFTDGTTRVMMQGYIFDEVAGTALTENDAAAARVDSKRAVVNVLEDATTRGQRASVSAGGALKVDGSAVTQPISGTVTASSAAGDVAHDGVDSGNPVKTGGQARTTNPTAVADADRSNFITDKLGKQVVVGSIRDLKVQQQTTITSSTSETTVLTAVASTFLDVYGVIVANTSASACDVSFKDSTAGTTRFNIYVPAGDTRGFMLNESAGHNQATVNNNWTATCGTSVASIKITMFAVKNV